VPAFGMVSSFLCFSLPFGFFMNLPPHHIKQHLSASDVHRRVVNMVEEITQSLDDKPLVIVGVLRGSFMFLADLVR
jgi:hypoxanthine-guanine phosphoribosyltransferase